MHGMFRLVSYRHFHLGERVAHLQELPWTFSSQLHPDQLSSSLQFSLHTEPSLEALREDRFLALSNYPALRESCTGHAPFLWENKEWAEQFARFITTKDGFGTLGYQRISQVEIHPPLVANPNSESFEPFEVNAGRFVELVDEHFLPELLRNTSTTWDVQIVMENRNVAKSASGRSFLCRSSSEFAALAEAIHSKQSRLKLVADIPQLLTVAEVRKLSHRDALKAIDRILEDLCMSRQQLAGLHISGWSHNPHLHTLFASGDGDGQLRRRLFSGLVAAFKDLDAPILLPEVNNGSAMEHETMLRELEEYGFRWQ